MQHVSSMIFYVQVLSLFPALLCVSHTIRPEPAERRGRPLAAWRRGRRRGAGRFLRRHPLKVGGRDSPREPRLYSADQQECGPADQESAPYRTLQAEIWSFRWISEIKSLLGEREAHICPPGVHVDWRVYNRFGFFLIIILQDKILQCNSPFFGERNLC